jgi:hypothetical protein
MDPSVRGIKFHSMQEQFARVRKQSAGRWGQRDNDSFGCLLISSTGAEREGNAWSKTNLS